MQNNNFYTDQNQCEMCQRRLPPKYNRKICPSCLEYMLFQHVKEFIRSGDFNEYQVAQKFNIPLSTVRKWIREGRIQYKESPQAKMTMHCQVCGEPLAFGSICSKCLKDHNVSGSLKAIFGKDSGNMHHLFIENDN